MYRTAQQEGWDNQNVLDFAMEKGLEEAAQTKANEIAMEMLKEGVDIEQIAKWTKLSKEQILSL